MKKYYTYVLSFISTSLIILSFSSQTHAQITSYATIPYSTGFESGSLEANWYTFSSNINGRIQIWNSATLIWGGDTAKAHTGNMWLGMDNSPGGTYVTNEAWMGFDLNGQSGIRLSFWWAEWNDETEIQDGVYISDNGGTTFTKVLDLNGASYTDLTWTHFNLSLDSINTLYGLSFTSTYVVKFQQYDNYYFAGGNDGFMFDDIDVYYTCSSSSSISPTVCDSYVSPSGNYTWTSSGTYLDIIPNAAGCDSVITVNLTVNSSSSTISPVTCADFISPSGNYTWTSSGTYMDTLPNAAGCDSVITINLMINNPSASIISTSVCGNYTSPSGNYTWTSSGTYIDTIPNATGCDSVITINLTISNPSSSSISPSMCNIYTSPSGNYTWISSGIYMDTIPNTSGCDSVITVNLTINNPSVSTISPTTCGSYVSPSGNYTWSSPGTYMDTIPNTGGCDSVITINLTLGTPSASTVSPTICQSYLSPSGNYTWTTSGTYMDTIPNTAGCDSVITINLTIISVDNSVTNTSPTLTSNAIGAVYQWLDCGNSYTVISGETGQSFTASVSGDYSVRVSQNGCTDTSACISIVISEITENDFSQSITAFPNPTNESVTVLMNNKFDYISTRVLNLTGQIISTKEFYRNEQILIEINGAPGVYFIELITVANEKIYIKVIKE